MLCVQHYIPLPNDNLHSTVPSSVAPNDFPNDTNFYVIKLELNLILLRQKSHKIPNPCLVIIHSGHDIDEESSEREALG